MPKYDGMGPKGEGPKTGRGLGNCDVLEKTDDAKILKPCGFRRFQGFCGRRGQGRNRQNDNRGN